MALEGLQLGHYHLVSLLGTGGMGEVYLAEDVRIGQRVAIKVSRTEGIAYPDNDVVKDAQRLFQREARAIAYLDHPRILPLYTYGEEQIKGMDLTYIVMPYRNEGSFGDWLQRRRTSGLGLLSTEDITYFIGQAASALQYAHDHHVIHQDVKPANFLLRSNPEQPQRPDLLLADFGIAKMSSATASESHTSRGTPIYMAPEQWSGHPVAATDQYALAVMAYELLTGRSPFTGRQEQVMYQHLMTLPQPPSSLNRSLSPAIDTVILRALAKQPAERYPSIADFARELQRAIASAPTVYAPLPAPPAEDIRATLTISDIEAREGTTRTVTLPGGNKTSVSIPKGAYDGQILILPGEGVAAQPGGTPGNLVLVLSVVPAEQPQQPTIDEDMAKTERASNPRIIPATEEQKRAAQPLQESQPLDPTEAVPPPPAAEKTELAPDNQGKTSVGIPALPITESVVPPKRGISRSKKPLIIGLLLVLVLLLGIIGGVIYAANTINRATATDAINSTIAQMNARNISQLDPALVASNPDPYPPTNGKLTLYDPMHDNSNQGFGWTKDNTCMFTGTAYQVGGVCSANNLEVNNFAFEITVDFTQTSSSQEAEIFFRQVGSPDTFYAFSINNNGTYDFDVGATNLFRASVFPISVYGIQSDAIHQSVQTNTMAIVAIGSTIDLYANGVKLNSFEDSSSNYGSMFLSNIGSPVNFSNAKLWTF